MLKQLEWWLICMTCVDEFFPLALPEGQHAFDTQAYVYYLRSQSDWTETSLYEAEMMNEWVEKLRKKRSALAGELYHYGKNACGNVVQFTINVKNLLNKVYEHFQLHTVQKFC